MMRFYVVLCFFAVLQLGSTLIWEDEDAIGIDAVKSKSKSKGKNYDIEIVEAGLDYDPYYGLPYGQGLDGLGYAQGVDGLGYAQSSNNDGFCRTRNGETGVCAPLAECYPVLYNVDSPHTAFRNLTNWPLAEELLRASGPCSNRPEDFRNNIICCSSIFEARFAVRRPVRPTKPAGKPVRISPTPPNCGVQKLPNRIVGEGEKQTVPRQGLYPWMAAIMIRGRQFCGGSLIDEYHIMTAAHCIQHMNSRDVSQLEIYLGAHDLYSASERNRVVRKASRVIYHKDFSHQTLLFDVAIIRLSRAVKYQNEPLVNVICLTTGNPRYDVSYPWVRLIGWGKLWDKGPQPSVLRYADVQVFPNQECSRRYGRIPRAGYIADHNVCAQGRKGTDACQGDSGGPLMRYFKNVNKWEQIGIVSWGVDCGRYPGVYTRVDSFLSWLDKQRSS